MTQEATQQESAPPPAEESPAEEATAEPATAVENNAAPAAPQAVAKDARPASAFPSGGGVEQVDQTCCGGFAKSSICAIQ